MNSQKSSADTLRIAVEIRNAAYERFGDVTPETFSAMLHERFPVGRGGVGHARRAIHREIRQALAEAYAPCEPREPTYGGTCG